MMWLGSGSAWSVLDPNYWPVEAFPLPSSNQASALTDYSALSQSSKVWSFPDLHGDECKHPHLATKTEYISLIRESFSVKLITERLVPTSEKECIIDLLS
ncbi:hypothetical protein QQF64_012304 [Cirrhinus molitorella]|uniref:Uncharacterized protein n=1 Tax=Cirrhinus molitorella TaxID=172907 RepID=A0ABR3LV61_9TELE